MAPHETASGWAELGARLQCGDERALECVLREMGPPIAGVLCHKFERVLSRDDIDDVLAIALFRLWQTRDSFDSNKGSLRVWFFRIAENAARDVLKVGWHKARRLEVDVSQMQIASTAADNGSTRANTAQPFNGTMKQTIREIINRLPIAQQRIISADIHCRDDVASSEWLAEELGIAQGSVRVYRKRALARIRDELERQGLFGDMGAERLGSKGNSNKEV